MGKLVKTIWVLTAKGADVRCRFMTEAFANGDSRKDVFAGVPLLVATRLPLSRTASSSQQDLFIIVLDISCEFLYAKVDRALYIELPVEGEVSRGGGWLVNWTKICKEPPPQARMAELG